VDPRAGLDDVEKRKFFTLQGLELRSLCRPPRSHSLYRSPSVTLKRINVQEWLQYILVEYLSAKVGTTSPTAAVARSV
jgi:hypothetical protein